MVSLVGNPQYQETSLDNPYYQPNYKKIYHCYKHIQGATIVTCDYSNDDEFLFGKHREWFCKFKRGRCMHKCYNCTELYRKCLEIEDCTGKTDADDQELDKKEKRKSFFSRFNKKNENKDDESNKEDEDTSHADQSVENEQKSPPKKSFFSIFGQDVQELENKEEATPNKEEEINKEEENEQSIEVREENPQVESEEHKPEKKKSFFKLSKKNEGHTEVVQSGTKWHDDSSDEELEEKPKKRSFFSRFSKRDLTKETDSEDEEKQSHLDQTETDEELNEQDKKGKKKSFFSRFSKKDLTKDSDSEVEEKSESTGVDQIESESIISTETDFEKKKEKKSFFRKFSRSHHSDEKKLESEAGSIQETSEIQESADQQEDKKEKKQKKSFFSRSPRKEQTEDQLEHEENKKEESDAESEIQKDTSLDVSETNKKEKKKSFFTIFSKKDEEKDIKNPNDNSTDEIKTESTENITETEKKEKKKSFFSKSSKNKKEKEETTEEEKEPEQEQENDIIDNPDILENQDETSDKEPKGIKRERRKSFLAIFNKKEEEVETTEADKENADENEVKNESKDENKEEHPDKAKKLTRKRSFLSKSKQDLTKHHKNDVNEILKTKCIEHCELCFTKFKMCPNNCFNCYTTMEEYDWFDHCVLKHAIIMESREYQEEVVAIYLNAEFNRKMPFCFMAFDFTFFFEFIFSEGSIIINMISNMDDYACKYFTCHYTVSWLDKNFSEELQYLGKEFWDWNIHTILPDNAVDDKFFDKCKLVIKVARLL